MLYFQCLRAFHLCFTQVRRSLFGKHRLVQIQRTLLCFLPGKGAVTVLLHLKLTEREKKEGVKAMNKDGVCGTKNRRKKKKKKTTISGMNTRSSPKNGYKISPLTTVEKQKKKTEALSVLQIKTYKLTFWNKTGDIWEIKPTVAGVANIASAFH